ncbi:hypothetical protein Ais01nite_69690 [Asanoa ishikariensis]|nr:hypothetical protein Ais01nite_69690 [Asanoa ishikariensis]
MVAVPIAALTALWIFATTLTLGPALSLLSAQGLLDDIGKPGETVVSALQQERRLSLVYLAGKSSPERLATQRTATDNAISEFRRRSAEADTSDLLAGRLAQLDQAFAVLPSGRDFIDRRDMDKAGALGLYNGVIDSAFRAFSVLIALPDEQLGREARAVTSLGRAREVLARADALVGGVFAGGRFGADEHGQLVQIIGTQRYLYENAVADLPDEDRAEYTRLTEGAAFSQLNDMLNTLVTKGSENGTPPISATAWQSSYDQVQHDLRDFELDASERLTDRTIPVATGILIRLGLAGFLGLVAVTVALYVSVRVGRELIRRLVGLRTAALSLADERLPALVGRLRHGQEVDVEAESPSLEFGSDELGQVGHAFAAVQRTAVTSAVDEAVLRRGLSEVFLNIARRSQTLLHRQLALLDKMERRTTDPDELGDLFRIDHLATRMRRHAEDLVVLAGAAPGRGWRVPVPMIDVIRGAVSEVEDYPRVTIMAIEPAAVAGRAVADVIHLLAELIENATSFSPPHTKVRVAGQAVPNGYAIEIEDRGLGMPPEAIVEANQRLSEPPEFDPGNSARLGLFVVAQLGARHGVRVQLRSSPYGGVTAVALLPTALIAAGTGALALPGRTPAEVGAPTDTALPPGVDEAVLVGADDSPVWTVPEVGATAGGDGTSAGAWSSSPGATWPTALSGGVTAPAYSPREPIATPPPVASPFAPVATTSSAEAAAQPTPVLGLPVQRRRRPPEEATTELVIGDDGLPRRNRQRHLAPQLRRSDDETSGAAPAPISAPPAARDPEDVRARMSALQAGTTRGRQESGTTTTGDLTAKAAERPMWTPPTADGNAGPALSDATRALRISRYTSPTTPAPGTPGNGVGSPDPDSAAAGNDAVTRNGADAPPLERRRPATETGASGELPDRTEGVRSVTPPVPSEQHPAPPTAGDRSAHPAPEGAQVKDPSGEDA